jgi:hypothetical protein
VKTRISSACRGCRGELAPPKGVIFYQLAADPEPGPMVAAIGIYGAPSPPRCRTPLARPAPGRTQLIRVPVDGQRQWVVVAVGGPRPVVPLLLRSAIGCPPHLGRRPVPPSPNCCPVPMC